VVLAIGGPEPPAVECNAAWFERKRAKTIEAAVALLVVDGHKVKRAVDDRHTDRAALQLHLAYRDTALVEIKNEQRGFVSVAK
jgi:hypothetical protein